MNNWFQKAEFSKNNGAAVRNITNYGCGDNFNGGEEIEELN